MVLLYGPRRMVFLVIEVPLYLAKGSCLTLHSSQAPTFALQEYLAHNKSPTPLRPS